MMDRRRFLWLACMGAAVAACGDRFSQGPTPRSNSGPQSSASSTTRASRSSTPTPSASRSVSPGASPSTDPSASPSDLEATTPAPHAETSETYTPEPVETLADPTADTSPSPTPSSGAPVVVEVVCRRHWGAKRAGSGAKRHSVSGVMVHHAAVAASDGDDEAARFVGYQRYHQDQSWPDIAYHLGIGRSGAFYQLRDPRTAGDTFTEYDPDGWFLILVDGDFDEQSPSTEQVVGLQRAIAWACARFDVSPDDVAGHRDAASTTCPGAQLYDRLPVINREAAEIMRRGGVQLRPTCDPRGFAAAWAGPGA